VVSPPSRAVAVSVVFSTVSPVESMESVTSVVVFSTSVSSVVFVV
jgi:hypothetical protein